MKQTNLILAAAVSVMGMTHLASRPDATARADALLPGGTSVAVAVASSGLAVEPGASDGQESSPTTRPTNENRPALPPGHPDLGAMMNPGGAAPGAPAGSAGAKPALPKGHPDIYGGGGGAAAGGSAMPGLPKGHPDLSGMAGAPATPPAPGQAPAQQPGANASITELGIRAVQGTVGGPAVGADEVRIEIVDLHTNRSVGSVSGNLSPEGNVRVGGIPVGQAFQPIVTVIHGGVEYRASGEPLASGKPQEIEVKVYESTDQPTPWQVRMRHVMIQATGAGVQVMEVMTIDNPTDKAFLGSVVTAGAKPVSFELPLPPNAADVKLLEGFHDCCSKIEPGKIVNTMAIVPGITQFQVSYTVPAVNGVTELLTVAPAATQHLMIFGPDDGTTIAPVNVPGAEVKLDAGVTDMGGKKVRFFKAAAVPAGAVIKLNVSGTPTRDSAARAAPSPGTPGAVATAGPGSPLASADASQVLKAVTGIGALLLVLTGGALLFIRKPAGKSA